MSSLQACTSFIASTRQRDSANTDEQEAVRRLEDKNRELSKLVE